MLLEIAQDLRQDASLGEETEDSSFLSDDSDIGLLTILRQAILCITISDVVLFLGDYSSSDGENDDDDDQLSSGGRLRGNSLLELRPKASSFYSSSPQLSRASNGHPSPDNFSEKEPGSPVAHTTKTFNVPYLVKHLNLKHVTMPASEAKKDELAEGSKTVSIKLQESGNEDSWRKEGRECSSRSKLFLYWSLSC